MTEQEYKAYISSPKWKSIAYKRMEIDHFMCQMCGSYGTANNELQVHHLTYKNLGNEENRIYEDLVTLCACCHSSVHRMMARVTGPDGRRGWKDNPATPIVSVLTLSGKEILSRRA